MRKLHVVPDDVPDLTDRRTPPSSVKRYLDSGTISDTDAVMAVPSATSKFDEMLADGRISDGATVPNGFSYLELAALLYEGFIYYDDNRFIAVVDGTVPEAEAEAEPPMAVESADGTRVPRCIDAPHLEFRLDPQPPKNYGIWKKGKNGVAYVRREMIRYLINLGIVADDNGEFLRWDGSIYRPIDESEVRNEIYDALFETDIELSISEMSNTLAQLASNARFARKEIPESFYDMASYDGEIVAFANGWYNITHDEWVRPSPNLFITRRFHATYDPSITSHPVADVVKGIIPDDDTRNFWYEMCGYIMFSPVITVPAMFVVYGPGETGKTALQKALETALGKEENVSFLDMSQLCGKFTLSGIENKLLNVCGETGNAMVNGYTVADGELLKKLSEGQTVTVDKKHAQPHSMTNTAKLLFVSNSIPNFGDTSSGLYRRLYIIPCRVKQNWDLQLYNLLTEETAQSYLVNEFLKGYLRFEARGRRFVPSKEMREEHTRFKAQESMMDFLLAFFGTTEREEVPAKLNGQYAQDVYRDYKSYVAETGGSALSQRKFNEKLRNEFGVGGVYVNAYREMPDGSRRTKLLQYTSGGDCGDDERHRLALQAGPARRRLPPTVAGGTEQAQRARACRGGYGPLGFQGRAGRHR